MKYVKTQCPLCNRSAEYYFCDHNAWRYYNCSYCKRYFILDGEEEKLLHQPEKWKLELSESSHKNDNKEDILVIKDGLRTPDSLDTEFVNRNLMPRC